MCENKIIIMCGGKGKRLGNLTESIPKTLIKIGEKTILEMKFDNYMNQGFKDFILCIGYKGNLIEKAVEEFKFPSNCKFSDDGEPAGILKRLNKAKDLFEDKVILTYGDTFADIKLSLLSEMHEKSGNEATIVVAPIQNPFGLVEFDSRGKVTYFKEKPILNYYIGYAVINKSALELIPQRITDMPDGDGLITFYRILMAMEKLGTFYHSGLQMTFNTEDELKYVRRKFADFYTTKEDK